VEDSSIFAIELCARFDRAPDLVATLRSTITDHPQAVGLQQKWALYRRATEALLAHSGMIERGCWDYFDDTKKAGKDFSMWLKGMTTEEGSRRGPSGQPDPYRGDPRYLTFTMAFLLVRPSPTDDAVSRLCNIPEPDLWRRSTFERILSGMGVINFASVKTDVMYLIPRDEDWGLTVDDLREQKFEYLRSVT
jgi:hypothetical protein